MVALLAAVVLVATLAVLAIVVATGDDTLVLDLDPGDCFDLPPGLEDDSIGTVDTVDCDAPHEAEVVATGELDPDGDAPYPSDAVLFEEVDRRCAAAVADRPDITAEFGMLPVVPNAESWEPFAGRYVCVAIPFGGGTVSGTLVP